MTPLLNPPKSRSAHLKKLLARIFFARGHGRGPTFVAPTGVPRMPWRRVGRRLAPGGK